MSNVILVTGSSSGFGSLIVKDLAREGYVVYASMRDISGKNKEKSIEFSNWAKKHNCTIHPIEIDVTNEQQVVLGVQTILDKERRIDVLVNNAGIGSYGVTEGFSDKQIRSIFDVNLFGSLNLARAVLPHMRKQASGLLIQISSFVGRVVVPFMSPYCSSKFAVESMFEGIAEELKDTGVEVCIIEPGRYATNFFNVLISPEQDLTDAYGEIARKSQLSMMHFNMHLKGPHASSIQEVSDAVLHLIKGDRHRRTLLSPPLAEIQTLNEFSAQVQQTLLHSFGLK